MEVKVALFGITKDIVGRSEIRCALTSPATVSALLDQLRGAYPRLQELSSLAVAVNSDYAESEQLLQAHDEIALIPPVSGG